MKNRILFAIILLLVAVMYNSCTTPPIEAAQDAYDYNAIVPKVLDGVQGPDIAIQTFTADYTIDYYRGGSTWEWSATDATVKSVSDDTRVATIEFNTFPADSFATVTVTETTMGGVTSDPVSKEVRVKKYCPLVDGVNDLVGSWSGTDATDGSDPYPSVITTEVSGSDLLVSGLSKGFIEGWWGETITEGGTCIMTINVDGTLDIPRQYIYTTDYEGDPYRYEVEGSGTWDNCGASPALIINYDIYYEGDADGLAATYGPDYLGGITQLTANITLDN